MLLLLTGGARHYLVGIDLVEALQNVENAVLNGGAVESAASVHAGKGQGNRPCGGSLVEGSAVDRGGRAEGAEHGG